MDFICKRTVESKVNSIYVQKWECPFYCQAIHWVYVFRVELGFNFIVSILIFGVHIPQISSAVGCCYSIFSIGVGLWEEFSQCLAFSRFSMSTWQPMSLCSCPSLGYELLLFCLLSLEAPGGHKVVSWFSCPLVLVRLCAELKGGAFLTFLCLLLWKPNSVMYHGVEYSTLHPVAAELCFTFVQDLGCEQSTPQKHMCFSYCQCKVGVQFFTPFLVFTDLCLGLPCGTVFCFSSRGKWLLLPVREGSQKQVCVLPASQQHWSPSTLLHHWGRVLQGLRPAPDISCVHLMEACGKDLENGYLCGNFPGILNSHVKPHSLFKNLLTF